MWTFENNEKRETEEDQNWGEKNIPKNPKRKEKWYKKKEIKKNRKKNGREESK